MKQAIDITLCQNAIIKIIVITMVAALELLFAESRKLFLSTVATYLMRFYQLTKTNLNLTVL